MKKIIATTLALIMCLGILSVLAFAAGNKMTVKVTAPAEWEECYVYAWEPEAFGSWPGTKLTDSSFELTAAVAGMVINAGESKPQTVDIRDLTFVAGTEVTIAVGDAGADGKHSYNIEVPSEPDPTTKPTETTQPTTTQPEPPADTEKYTLTVEVPSSWTTVYVYTWEPETFGSYPGLAMSPKSENTYECEIPSDLVYLVFSNQDHVQTSDLMIRSGSDVAIKISEDAQATITYPGLARPLPLPGDYELSEYRVVGNADWLGAWDPAFEGGRMHNMGDGVYRKNFEDVAPGSYEIKITKDGKWDGAYGYEGQNFCFTVFEKTKVTVDFVLRDGVGIIEVYGTGRVLDEDEDEPNPKASDLSVMIPAVLLLTSAVVLPVALSKRKNIQ